MLDACKVLHIAFRAETKAHKTLELARLQTGGNSDDDGPPARITVSTLIEGQMHVQDVTMKQDRKIEVLYGLPAAPGDAAGLYDMARSLDNSNTGKVGVLVDHPGQLEHIRSCQPKNAPGRACFNVYIKLNVGSGRAGVWYNSEAFERLIDTALECQADGCIRLAGMYAHTSHSTFGAGGDRQRNLLEAMYYLERQFIIMRNAACRILTRAEEKVVALGPEPLVLSAGVRCLEVLETLADSARGLHDEDNGRVESEAAGFLWLLNDMRSSGFVTAEIHAGSHATMDLRQLSIAQGMGPATSWDDLALTVLAEVRSVYGDPPEDRGEALVGAGSLALGKETCGDSRLGWGVVAPWGRPDRHAEKPQKLEDPGVAKQDDVTGVACRDLLSVQGQSRHLRFEGYEGWIVGRLISQEHGILQWLPGCPSRPCDRVGDNCGDCTNGCCCALDDEANRPIKRTVQNKLFVGQRIRIWPNSASMASSQFGLFLVVDSERQGKEDEVVDIWPRAREG